MSSKYFESRLSIAFIWGRNIIYIYSYFILIKKRVVRARTLISLFFWLLINLIRPLFPGSIWSLGCTRTRVSSISKIIVRATKHKDLPHNTILTWNVFREQAVVNTLSYPRHLFISCLLHLWKPSSYLYNRILNLKLLGSHWSDIFRKGLFLFWAPRGHSSCSWGYSRGEKVLFVHIVKRGSIDELFVIWRIAWVNRRHIFIT